MRPQLHSKEKAHVGPGPLPVENSWFRLRLHNWILKTHKGKKNQVMQSDAAERLIIERVVRRGGSGQRTVVWSLLPGSGAGVHSESCWGSQPLNS